MSKIEQIKTEHLNKIKQAELEYKNICDQYKSDDRYSLMQRGKAFNNLNRTKADYIRAIKNHSKIIPLLKKYGLPIAKSTSTAIRGYKNWSYGFKIQSDAAGIYLFYQAQGHTTLGTYKTLSKDQIEYAITILTNAGYKVIEKNYIEIISFDWDK